MTVLKRYTEGKVTFLTADVEYYTAKTGQPTSDMPVFYNPRMQLNRDLSVVFLSAFMRDIDVERICEPLAGSGVRTIRYLIECPGNFEAVMFDTNPQAVEIARKNVAMNSLESRASVIKGDARVLLLNESRERRFDFVDVDPFGTPVPFLNAAIQSILPRKGMLALTATDMPALCGVFPQVALRKYGGLSIRAPFTHEIAVRLLIGRAVSIAGLNDCSVVPLASLSTDHYVRVWLRLDMSRSLANTLTNNIGIVEYYPDCMDARMVPLGDIGSENVLEHSERCVSKTIVAGPLWIGPLFNEEFLRHAVDVAEDAVHLTRRAKKIIDLMMAEQELATLPYVDLHVLCDSLRLSPPPRQDVVDQLTAMGYRVSRTHFRPTAIRTDAPVKTVRAVLEHLNRER
ncbi:MAG: tRNA (guanine(10)-N(2))-dimethyltransferase [Candidatus Thorarchaeota archaeon]